MFRCTGVRDIMNPSSSSEVIEMPPVAPNCSLVLNRTGYRFQLLSPMQATIIGSPVHFSSTFLSLCPKASLVNLHLCLFPCLHHPVFLLLALSLFDHSSRPFVRFFRTFCNRAFVTSLLLQVPAYGELCFMKSGFSLPSLPWKLIYTFCFFLPF